MADGRTGDGVYSLPLDITPAVTIPSVFLRDARESVVPPSGRRTGPYGVPLKTFGCREKILAVALIIVIVTLISLISSLVFVYCHIKNHEDQKELTFQAESQEYGIHTVYQHSSGSSNYTNVILQEIHTVDSNRDSQRTPCIRKCWEYSAFRFRSQCIMGYCRCHGPFYNVDTCLPDVYGCQIVRNKTEASAFFGKDPQTVYTCSSPKGRQSGVHVISTYGHHNSASTEVNITGLTTETQPITLILANYYPTKWRLRLDPGVNFDEIVIMSNDHVEDSFVEVTNSSEVSRDSLRIRRVSAVVGYGDDRRGEHTVGLLKYVIRHFGPIASFSGAHYADRWRVSLQSQKQNGGLDYSDLIR